jgi:hypothetical protein
MPNYLVRVELHGAEDQRDVYDQLHEAMEAGGYLRTIQMNKGTRKLPNATYSRGNVSLDGETVTNQVAEIVASVWKEHSIVVADWNDLWGRNLEKS